MVGERKEEKVGKEPRQSAEMWGSYSQPHTKYVVLRWRNGAVEPEW